LGKVTFAINITVNGTADHTTVIADDELHDFYTNLLKNMDVILFGRKTYQLMEGFWPVAYKNKQSTKSMIRFADIINPINKIVFSNTLKEVKWQNSHLANGSLQKIISELKKQKNKNISAGSLSIATQLLKLNLIDEFWFVVHPIIAVNNKKLFEEFNDRKNLKFIDLKKFNSGVVGLHYQKEENIVPKHSEEKII
jgi:dihydrofolate reductase